MDRQTDRHAHRRAYTQLSTPLIVLSCCKCKTLIFNLCRKLYLLCETFHGKKKRVFSVNANRFCGILLQF